MESDNCILNPANCDQGLSFSLFYMPDYTYSDSQMANLDTEFPREYILSSGGDLGHPGFAIYLQGGTLGVILSTGSQNWVVEVVGGIPERGKWSNIAARWRPLNYENLEEMNLRLIQGEKVGNEDFGGLAVFVDLERVGFSHLPEEDSENVKESLAPPEVLLGCHKTSDNGETRMFASGSFDEVAIWEYWINDTVKPFFLGGYSNTFSFEL